MSDDEASPASTQRSIKNNRVERSTFNKRAFECLPQDVRDAVTREFDRSAMDERADMARRGNPLRQERTGKGLKFMDADRTPIRDALGKSTFDLLQGVKSKFGNEAWARLETTSGKLV